MMTIREMTAGHLPQIAELERQCFPDPWSLKSLTSELTNPLSLWLVAESAGEVVGYAGSQAVLGEADVMNLAVAPAHRREGIGEALMLALIRRLQASGVTSLTLEVRASNAAAQALYAKLGFAQVGLRPHYYEKPREDARILRKEWSV